MKGNIEGEESWSHLRKSLRFNTWLAAINLALTFIILVKVYCCYDH